MKLVDLTELDDIQLIQKYNTPLLTKSQYQSELIFIPFAYKHGTDLYVRRVVLLWSLQVTLYDTQVLSIEAEDSCVIHAVDGEMKKHEFARILVNYSFAKVARKYQSLCISER